MFNLIENLMSFFDFCLKVVKRILEMIIEKYLSLVRSMFIINFFYIFYRSNKIVYIFVKNNYYFRVIYEKKIYEFVYILCLFLYRYK